MLPKDANAAAKVFDGKPSNASKLPEYLGGHNQGGSVGDNYQNYVGNKLEELNKKYERDLASGKPWSQEKLLDEMKRLEDGIKNDLLTGKSPALCSTCKAGEI